MSRRRNRRERAHRREVVGITAVVAVLLISLSVQSHTLEEKNAAYEEQEAKLTAQIEDEEARAEEIAGLEEYMQSDEYIEQAARDKLGLVYPDEILIKPSK
jgi:cell division protein DivIC